MDYPVACKNIDTMCSHTKDIYYVDGDKIKTVSRFNIFGRLYHFFAGDSKTSLVKDKIAETLSSISSLYGQAHQNIKAAKDVLRADGTIGQMDVIDSFGNALRNEQRGVQKKLSTLYDVEIVKNTQDLYNRLYNAIAKLG